MTKCIQYGRRFHQLIRSGGSLGFRIDRILILPLWIALSHALILNTMAQSSAMLTGTVLDQATKKPLENVNVIVKDTHLGDASDSLGFYEIRRIPPELQVIEFRYVGYKTKYRTYQFKEGQSVVLDIMLEQEPIKLREVTVTDTVNRAYLIHRYPGSIVITRQQILETGENRMTKLMQQLLPRFDLYATRIRSRKSRQPLNLMLIIDGVRVRVDSYEFIFHDPDYLDKFVTPDEIDHIIIHRDANAWLRSGARRLENVDWAIEIIRRKP